MILEKKIKGVGIGIFVVVIALVYAMATDTAPPGPDGATVSSPIQSGKGFNCSDFNGGYAL